MSKRTALRRCLFCGKDVNPGTSILIEKVNGTDKNTYKSDGKEYEIRNCTIPGGELRIKYSRGRRPKNLCHPDCLQHSINLFKSNIDPKGYIEKWKADH